MTVELIQYVHEAIFGEIFEWAGRWRSVNISKPGTIWPPPTYLDQNMQQFDRTVLRKYQIASLSDDESFIQAIAEIQGEFLSIHPFREGNARTIKLITNLLAAQTGRPLLTYDERSEGRDRYIDAAKAALHIDYEPLKAVIRDALARAREPLVSLSDPA